MMVFHCFRGLEQFKQNSDASFNELQKNKSNITIANYRQVPYMLLFLRNLLKKRQLAFENYIGNALFISIA